MRKKIIILFIVLLVKVSGFTINENNPLEFLNCYIYVIKRAIEEHKWNLDLTVKDSLCTDYLSTYDLLIDKDTLWIIPKDYTKNKYKLKSFLFSDSIAIVQFQLETMLIKEKGRHGNNYKHKNNCIEFNVVLDSSKETGVRVNFGHPISLDDKKNK